MLKNFNFQLFVTCDYSKYICKKFLPRLKYFKKLIKIALFSFIISYKKFKSEKRFLIYILKYKCV